MEYAPAGTAFTFLAAAKYAGVCPICTNQAFLYRYSASCCDAAAEAAAEPPSMVFQRLTGLISRPGLGMESPQTNPGYFPTSTRGTLFSSGIDEKLIFTPMAAKACCTVG